MTNINDLNAAFDKGLADNYNIVAVPIIQPKKEQWNGSYINVHNAKLIKQAVENGTAPFLPNEQGVINPSPIYNANTGYCLTGKDLVPLQIERNNRHLNSNIVVTSNSISNANTRVKPEEKGMYYNYKNTKDNTFHHSMYFFPEQTENPDKIYDIYGDKIQGYHPIIKDLDARTINRAEDYMALYLFANKTGVSLKVSPEVAKDFSEKFMGVIDNEILSPKERNPNVKRMNEFFYDNDVIATKIIKNFEKSLEEAVKPKTKSIERKPQEITRDL